jgi:DNA processing protein
VAERGAVLSEQAPGSRGARWRFAVRNRIMAALAHVVVVVECHAEGGALHTVRAARRRGVPLAAVPGSPHSAASAGTNALLVDGARCVRGGADVLDLVAEITGHRLRPRSLPAGEPGVAPDPVAGDHQTRALEASAARVLRLLGPDPLDLARLVERAGQPLGFVALALEQLADRGLAVAERGWWRRVPPSGRQR